MHSTFVRLTMTPIATVGGRTEHTPVFSIPKTSLLSVHTSSLPPLSSSSSPEPITNASILHLALCVLHEIRLAELSPFHGYLQSLPRSFAGCELPIFWHVPEMGGDDGAEGLLWLLGSEVEKRIASKAAEGLGYVSLLEWPRRLTDIIV
jgi:hypothetical protein